MTNDRLGSEQERTRSRALRQTQIVGRLTRLTDAYLEGTLDIAEYQHRKTALELSAAS